MELLPRSQQPCENDEEKIQLGLNEVQIRLTGLGSKKKTEKKDWIEKIRENVTELHATRDLNYAEISEVNQ